MIWNTCFHKDIRLQKIRSWTLSLFTLVLVETFNYLVSWKISLMENPEIRGNKVTDPHEKNNLMRRKISGKLDLTFFFIICYLRKSKQVKVMHSKRPYELTRKFPSASEARPKWTENTLIRGALALGAIFKRRNMQRGGSTTAEDAVTLTHLTLPKWVTYPPARPTSTPRWC